MRHRQPVSLSLLLLFLAAPGSAQDTGNFVVRLGQDTTAFERYTRTAAQVVVDQVGLSPRVMQRKFTYDFAEGDVSRIRMVVTRPGSESPTQTIEGTFGPDSARLRIQSANAPPQNVVLVVPKGTVVIAASSPWTGYEGFLMRFSREKRDSLRAALYLMGGNSTTWVLAQRLGGDSIAITNGRNDRYHVRVDRDGRILGVMPVAGTARYAVVRVPSLDLEAMTTAFAGREQGGAGVGALSPRDSVVTTVAGAALWIDYGRPAKRGRVIFGDLIPFGEVWRTGANAATQFRTDRALDFGGTLVPPGFYTLWAVPTANGWTMRFNGETGQWGTAHKPDRDLYSIVMTVTTLPSSVERFTIGILPSPQGGTLTLDWDTTRASASFTIKP